MTKEKRKSRLRARTKPMKKSNIIKLTIIISAVLFAGLFVTLLITNNASAGKKAYTVFLLINGTDLETYNGCAAEDIDEMLSSEFDPDVVNVLLMTGGTAKWHNDDIPVYTCISRIDGAGLTELASMGEASVVDYKTVSQFIDYGIKNFPAEKYGFVFWNHGGGTVGGYGVDELNDYAGMSAQEIGYAFANSKAAKNHFEFIGFDCCLMATAEIALHISHYADYMIASEELEPGYGWDYKWLKGLSDNPITNGVEIGKVIVDSFVESYAETGWDATLSVIDLKKLTPLFADLNVLSKSAENEIDTGGFSFISKARKGTKSFAVYTPEADSYDLIDIKHFAKQLEHMFPDEAAALITAAENAVAYYRNTGSVSNAYGISTYFPYLSKEVAKHSVPYYKSLDEDAGVQANFISFMEAFYKNLILPRIERPEINNAVPSIQNGSEVSIKLDPDTLDEINQITFIIWKQLEEESDWFIKLGVDTNVDIAPDGTITTIFDGYWAVLGGETACFYEYERAGDTVKYMTPAVLNGEEVKLLLLFGDNYPDGKLLGAIPPPPEGGRVASKNIIPVNKGDRLALKYFAQLFVEDEANIDKYDEVEKWITGEEFTVSTDELTIEIEPVDDNLYLYGFWIEDVHNNNYYTDFIEIRY